MIRKLLLIPALLIAFSASPALASDWRLVTVDEDVGEENGRSVAGFIDYESLRREGPRVTFWLMFVSEEPARSGMDHARARIEADCTTRRYRYRQRIFYNGERELGRTGDSDRETAEPETNAYVVIEAACTGIPEGAETVADPYVAGRAALRALRARGPGGKS